MNSPSDIAFDSSGNLYVVGVGEISKYDSSGNLSTFVSGLNGPWGIAVIPEPTTIILLTLGGLALRKFRR